MEQEEQLVLTLLMLDPMESYGHYQLRSGNVYIIQEWRFGMEKHCNTCDRDLPITEFHKRTYKDGRVKTQSKCRSCSTTVRREYYKPHEYARRKFKLSEEDYNTLMEHTNCQVCGVHMDKKCIDHDHKTEKIRGVLCNNCNTALGLFKDDVSVLEKSIRYLERSKQLQ